MAKNPLNVRVVYDLITPYGKALQSGVLTGRVVEKAARDIEATAKASMVGQSPPAPPGSPPAVRTGTLANSIQSSKVGPSHWRVTVGAEYGIYLEYGTARMGARPFMAPAVEQVRPAFVQAMKQALKSGPAT